jgi:hypothetical protein
MEFPENPDAWMDVFDHGVVVLGAIALAVVPGWLQAYKNHREIKKVGRQNAEDLGAIRDQVVNGHADSPGLREDVDHIKDDVKAVMATLAEWATLIPIVRALSSEVPGLRHDLAAARKDLADEVAIERESRRDLARDVRADMQRNREEITEIRRNNANG